jgi:ribose-phosphate pyrophosphokinase
LKTNKKAGRKWPAFFMTVLVVKGIMVAEFICLQSTVLAQKIADSFYKPLHQAKFITFADGEINVTLENPVLFHGKIVTIIQSTGNPTNDFLLGTAFLAQELKNAGASTVIAVLPYFGYSRQERSSIAGKPGHAKVVAQLLQDAGIDELITVQLHDASIIDFFSIPVHDLSAASTIAMHIQKQQKTLKDICLVAPDKGAHEYVESIARRIGVHSLLFLKERFAKDKTRIVGIAGDCHGATAVIIDDIIATGGTAIQVAHELAERGYTNIEGYFVHPVFAGDAVARIETSDFDRLYVSNTLPLPSGTKDSFIQQFDVSHNIVELLRKIIG